MKNRSTATGSGIQRRQPCGGVSSHRTGDRLRRQLRVSVENRRRRPTLGPCLYWIQCGDYGHCPGSGGYADRICQFLVPICQSAVDGVKSLDGGATFEAVLMVKMLPASIIPSTLWPLTRRTTPTSGPAEAISFNTGPTVICGKPGRRAAPGTGITHWTTM